jgi:hypothetical protein
MALIILHILVNTCLWERFKHGRMNYKDTKPYMSAFLSVDLLTDFAALCLTDFRDWRYTHSWFVFLTQLVNCSPPWMKELYLCTVAPLLYLLSDLLPLPNVQYMQTICDWGGGGWGVLKCTVDHILQELYTLFLTRFGTYKIASPPQTK